MPTPHQVEWEILMTTDDPPKISLRLCLSKNDHHPFIPCLYNSETNKIIQLTIPH